MGCCVGKYHSKDNTTLKMEENSLINKLKECNTKTPKFTLEGYHTSAKCVKCYDADTVHLVFGAPGTNNLYKWNCRLLGIDSAEIRSKDPEEKAYAIKARDYLRELILDKIVDVTCQEFDKYGRVLVTITHDGINLNEDLVTKKMAYRYDGGTKKSFKDWSGLTDKVDSQ
jgi:endonuclease YncB( thermonuclease family)